MTDKIYNTPKLDRILFKLCKYLIEKVKSQEYGYYGWIAAGILDPQNRLVMGINVPGDDNKRVHAERSAIIAYENKYGPIPQGSICITTCSPCQHHMDATQGECCASLLNSVGIKKVYCGFSDPTHYPRMVEPVYKMATTKNKALNELCAKFARTWLGKKATTLTESVSSVVYHFSPLYSASEILKQKRFRLTTSSGTKTEKELQTRDTLYYFSTTRSKIGDYTLHGAYRDGVVFKLNGDWLNNNLRGGPVDYWRGSLIPQGFSQHDPLGFRGRYKEMEDRVFSKKPFIDFPSPALKLIQEIHVLYIKDKYSHDKYPLYLRSILLNASRLGLPVWVYDNRESFFLQNKKKSVAITPSFLKSLADPKPETFGTSNPQWPRTDYFKPWRELYYKNKRSELSSKAKDVLYKVEYSWGIGPSAGLDNDIHNQKRELPPGLLKLFDIFKKLNISDPVEYKEYLEKKWKDISD